LPQDTEENVLKREGGLLGNIFSISGLDVHFLPRVYRNQIFILRDLMFGLPEKVFLFL